MSRYLEIQDEAERSMGKLSNYAVHGFIRGAEWADKGWLDRACKWLEDMNAQELSEGLRKAMEK